MVFDTFDLTFFFFLSFFLHLSKHSTLLLKLFVIISTAVALSVLGESFDCSKLLNQGMTNSFCIHLHEIETHIEIFRKRTK